MDSISKNNAFGQIRENADLSKTNWFQVGGHTKYLFKPNSTNDLSVFLQQNDLKYDILPLGVGSNVIIRDKGFDGVVIKLGRKFTNIDIDKNFVKIGCGALDYNVAQFLASKGLSGIEFYAGIPGAIGGAVAMNAGAYGAETSEFLIKCEAVRVSDGKKFILTNKEFRFVYRGNSLSEHFIFTTAEFKLYNKSPEKIHQKITEISLNRERTQPIRSKTGGSTFKNPPGYKAWQLIDQCGLRGFSIGGAKISEKHCNFMINTGNATATDLENLGEHIIKTVYQKTGIKLEWEIKRIGIK